MTNVTRIYRCNVDKVESLAYCWLKGAADNCMLPYLGPYFGEPSQWFQEQGLRHFVYIYQANIISQTFTPYQPRSVKGFCKKKISSSNRNKSEPNNLS